MQTKPKVDSLIAFLGAPQRGYSDATYIWESQTYRTPFCAEALVKFFNPDKLVVMVTDTAREANLASLRTRVEALGCEVLPATIPESGSEEALWDMFEACVHFIEPGERVIFDITNGFRYIPMMMLLAGQFLNVTQNVQTVGIYYGAFEAPDADGRTPILSLQSLAELMIWIQAVSHFSQTGNASPLVDRIDKTSDRTFRAIRWHLYWVSQGLRLGLATEVGRAVHDLLIEVNRPPKVAQREPASRPMEMLMQQITQKYKPLALSPKITESLDENTLPEHLRQQAALLSWYVENELALQAWLLAREWLISWVIKDAFEAIVENLFKAHEDKTQYNYLDEDVRRTASTMMMHIVLGQSYGAKIEAKTKGDADLAKLKSVNQLHVVLDVWRKCYRVRNQLAHMSMRSSTRRTTEIRRIQMYLQQIERKITELAETLPPVK